MPTNSSRTRAKRKDMTRLDKMMQDITLLRRLWVLIVLLTVNPVSLYGLDHLTDMAVPLRRPGA